MAMQIVSDVKKYSVEDYFNDLPNIRLSQLQKKYLKVSEDDRGKLVSRMSNGLVLLTAMAVTFPEDVQKYIYKCMLNADDITVDNVYQQPISITFSTCHNIVKVIGFNKPIAPLYSMNGEERNKVLNGLAELNASSDGIMSEKKLHEIRSMNESIQQYFKGLEVAVFSKEDMEKAFRIKKYFFALITSTAIVGGVGIMTQNSSAIYLSGMCGFLSLVCLRDMYYQEKNALCQIITEQ